MSADTRHGAVRDRVFGTDVLVAGVPPAAQAAALAALHRVEAVFSRFRPGSDLCRVDAAGGAPVRVAPVFAAALADACAHARATGGIFSPLLGREVAATGYAVDLAHVPGRPAGPLPPPVPAPRVRIDHDTSTVTVPAGVGLDLGGFVKGWAVQRVADELRAGGAPRGLIDAGGDIACWTDGEPWRIGLPLPGSVDLSGSGDLPGSVDLSGSGELFGSASLFGPGDLSSQAGRPGPDAGAGSLDRPGPGACPPGSATRCEAVPPSDGPPPTTLVCSGRAAVATGSTMARAWRDAGGTTRHHVIDPRTGRPARSGFVQVTAWASGEDADLGALEAATTGLLVLGPGAGPALLAERYPGTTWLALDRSGVVSGGGVETGDAAAGSRVRMITVRGPGVPPAGPGVHNRRSWRRPTPGGSP